MHEGGKHALRLKAVIDARSVLGSVSGAEVKVPTDQGMLIHALRLRELLQTQVEALWWVDAQDMIADVSKGLKQLSAGGLWILFLRPFSMKGEYDHMLLP